MQSVFVLTYLYVIMEEIRTTYTVIVILQYWGEHKASDRQTRWYLLFQIPQRQSLLLQVSLK